MRRFIDLVEAKDTVVFTFGRFNPPTIGHEKLISKVAKVAEKKQPVAKKTEDKDSKVSAKVVASPKKAAPKKDK